MTTQRAPRKYEQKRRAEQQAETRRRIVEAMVALHAEVGPARTTISAIAERAGVERLTVYRHFGDETAMFEACSAHFASEVVAPPDPAAWSGIAGAAERLQAALRAFYAYYRRAEPMLVHVHRDLPTLPALAAVMAPWDALVADVRDGVVAAWAAEGLAGGAARARLTAVVAHALRFETWRSLARAGAPDAAPDAAPGDAHVDAIGDAEAADLMVALARAAAARA